MAELVMDVESEFSVQIPYERFADILTVGDLCATVSSLLQTNGRPVCRTLPAFCTLRRGFMDLGQTHKNIRPSTALRALFRETSWPEAWHRLSAATGYRLPELQRPGLLVVLLTIFPMIAIGWMIFASLHWPNAEGFVWALPAMIISLPFYAVISFWMTRPLATALPQRCKTVGDLVREALHLNDIRVANDPPHPPAEQLFPQIKKIVSEVLNIPEAEIHADSRFIEDLQAG
ncbi:MAG: hypothetical protein SH850_12705 [Planctomycetaceae bacterium]|nr:hypothetical protein [Planctomycetaceae bacterium]